jgi:hypothetical protein
VILWNRHVFRRGSDVESLWDQMFTRRRREGKPCRLLYVAGRGFDSRARIVLQKFVASLRDSGCEVEHAKLILVGFDGYQLSAELLQETDQNIKELTQIFSVFGGCQEEIIGKGPDDDISTSNALRSSTEGIVKLITDHSDVILDVSSMPRIAYLSLMLGLLRRLVPSKGGGAPLATSGINFQVLVGEDPELDGKIRSEDPSNELVLIPGYASALHAESTRDWPLVWFPVLGEGRVGQLQKVLADQIPESAEICPVIPHPSRDPRRGDRLLLEYKIPLFDERETPLTNVMYAHESNPFESYRQLLGAMQRYRDSMSVLGGCRLVVTPFSSKLITLGAALACYEMRLDMASDYGVAIPYAEPQRYVVSVADLKASEPEVSAMVLAGEAYALDGKG